MKKTIEVEAYTDSRGNPTCAESFESGNACRFFKTLENGYLVVCRFPVNDSVKLTPLKRRENGAGSLIPMEECPVWKGDERVKASRFHRAVLTLKKFTGKSVLVFCAQWGQGTVKLPVSVLPRWVKRVPSIVICQATIEDTELTVKDFERGSQTTANGLDVEFKKACKK